MVLEHSFQKYNLLLHNSVSSFPGFGLGTPTSRRCPTGQRLKTLRFQALTSVPWT